ncbi:hypothetical protein VN12_17130 [Pirellula sp. SH-Sr6A]|nr:hypothetical protein VN12_17130 [Pirellula sp. SH-Sr6A]
MATSALPSLFLASNWPIPARDTCNACLLLQSPSCQPHLAIEMRFNAAFFINRCRSSLYLLKCQRAFGKHSMVRVLLFPLGFGNPY